MSIKARTRDEGIATLATWAEQPGAGPIGSAVFATGIPTANQLNPFGGLLADMGYAYFQLQYRGTLDSDGDFTPQNCISTILEYREILRSSRGFDLKSETEFSFSDEQTVLLGHSFGTYAAMGALLSRADFDKCVMFSPMFEFGTRAARAGVVVDLERHVRHIHRAVPLTFRIRDYDLWDSFFNRDEEFFVAATPPQKPVEVLVVCGDNDPSIDVQRSQSYVKEFLEEHARHVTLRDYIVVEGGGHSLPSLMTDEVVSEISRFCGS